MINFFSRTFDKIPLALLITNKNNQVKYANSKLAELIGINSGNIQNNLKAIIKHLPDLSKVSSDSEVEIRTADGKVVTTLVKVNEIDKNYQLFTFDQPLSNEQSFHAQRLQTLGLLTCGLVHDFNNILTSIIGHASFLKSSLKDASGEQDKYILSLNAIEEGSHKASLITAEILNFSKQGSTSNEGPVNISELVKKTVNLLLGSLSPKTSIESSLPKETFFVNGPEVRVSQILINTVVNAHEAVCETNGNDNTISVNVMKSPKYQNMIMLTVSDCGKGMDEDTKERIFQPYFTTKGERGTGLGLNTVLSIVNEFEGYIDVDSEINHGTTIHVHLPLAQAAQPEISESTEPIKQQSKNKRVLVVDDEDFVLEVLNLNLKELNYTVDTCSNAKEALLLFKNNKSDYEFIIMDMLMPEMSGIEALKLMRRVSPKQRFLMISGYCSEDDREEIAEFDGVDFLSKPFTIEELASKLNE